MSRHEPMSCATVLVALAVFVAVCAAIMLLYSGWPRLADVTPTPAILPAPTRTPTAALR